MNLMLLVTLCHSTETVILSPVTGTTSQE